MSLTAEFQREMSDGWKKTRHDIESLTQRKKNLCPKCAKDNFKVKMEFMKDCYTKDQKMTQYKVEFWGCPRCHYLDKKFFRTEKKGTSGVALGKDYGQL